MGETNCTAKGGHGFKHRLDVKSLDDDGVRTMGEG